MLLMSTATLITQRMLQIALRRRAVHGQHDAMAALRFLLCVCEPRRQRALLSHLLCVALSHLLRSSWVCGPGRHRAVCC